MYDTLLADQFVDTWDVSSFCTIMNQSDANILVPVFHRSSHALLSGVHLGVSCLVMEQTLKVVRNWMK